METLTRLTKSEKPLKYEFPVLKCTKCDDSGEKINCDISVDLIGFDIQDSIVFYTKIQPDIDSLTPPIVDLSYRVNLLTNRFYSITFFAEGCGAYCESFEKSYNYDFMNNNFIQLKDLFTQNGLTKFITHLETSKRDRLNQYFAEKRESITDNDEQKDFLLMEDLYSECYKNTSFSYALEYLDFYYTKNELTIFSERCSNHALMGLDKIGAFVYRINLTEWKNYLSRYGKSLIIKP